MRNLFDLFDKTFFKFLLGFTAVISVSIFLLGIASGYGG